MFPNISSSPVSYRPQNRVLRRIFWPKKSRVVCDWRKLLNNKFRNLYSLPDIVKMIKLGKMKSEGHVAHMRENMNAYRMSAGKPEGKRPLWRSRSRWEDILKLICERQDGVIWTGLIWLRMGTSESFCEHGNEPTGTIKLWKILE
jgi:hypothetical protein